MIKSILFHLSAEGALRLARVLKLQSDEAGRGNLVRVFEEKKP